MADPIPQPASPKPNPNDPGSSLIPNNLMFYQMVSLFLLKWGNMASQFVAQAVEEVGAMPLEQSILFHEPVEGLLIVRTTREFEKYMNEWINGSKNDKDAHRSGLFMEMVVLFWHQMVLQIWKKDTRKLPPAILKRSVPMDWPDRKPATQCTIFVKDHPVDIRLWTPLTGPEMEKWKIPSPK